MFDHLEFFVSDIVAARAFYGAICKAIGVEEMFFDAGGKELGLGRGDITHMLLMQGAPTQPPMHMCFVAPDRASVDAAHAAALTNGGICNGKPGYRDHYGPGYYAAFMRDGDGHNVEVLFREP